MFTGLLWVELFFMFVFTMLIAVPRPAIIRLLPVGLIGGFGQSLILLGFMVPLLKVWKFNYANIFSVDGIPLFIAMAWAPVVVIYSYYLSLVKDRVGLYSYLAAFALATALYVHWLENAGYMRFLKWNSVFTAIMAVILFSPITYYFYRINDGVRDYVEE